MTRRKFKSNNERDTYQALRKLFPNCPIISEHSLGERLHLDFLVKSVLDIGIEVDGEQHYGFVSRFHRDRNDFKLQRKRDHRKDELCREQGISLVRIDARGGVDLKQLEQALSFVLDYPCKPKEKEANPYKERVRQVRKERYANRKEYLKRKRGE